MTPDPKTNGQRCHEPPSSGPRADKALGQVICHNEIKVRVGVITDSL